MGTNFDYQEFTQPAPNGLIYQRHAFVPQGKKFLRLTRTDDAGNPQPNSIGRVVYSPEVQLWEPGGSQAGFRTTFKFYITDFNNTPAADGIAFFIAPVDYPVESFGGGLGIYTEANNGPPYFAVEFDTYKNNWDPSDSHVGINVSSRGSQASRNFRFSREVVTADVVYDANAQNITVTADSGQQHVTFSYGVDLQKLLPQTVQVGISSATGNLVATHDLISWSFTSTAV